MNGALKIMHSDKPQTKNSCCTPRCPSRVDSPLGPQTPSRHFCWRPNTEQRTPLPTKRCWELGPHPTHPVKHGADASSAWARQEAQEQREAGAHSTRRRGGPSTPGASAPGPRSRYGRRERRWRTGEWRWRTGERARRRRGETRPVWGTCCCACLVRRDGRRAGTTGSERCVSTGGRPHCAHAIGPHAARHEARRGGG